MNFDLDMFLSAAVGAARIKEEADGFHFFRFTEKEEEYYSNSSFYGRTFSTAGIKLIFRTDSPYLLLSVSVSEATTRSFFAFDIFADGEKMGSVTNIPPEGIIFEEDTVTPINVKLPMGDFSGRFELGEGEKTVKIYFPWSVTPVVKSLEIADGSHFSAAPPPRKMLIFGDSITHGYDALYPSKAYSAYLSDALMADGRNLAIGGERFCPGLALACDGGEIEIITVAYGTNDWNTKEKADFERCCEVFYRTLSEKFPKAKIFAITPIWRRDGNAEKPCGSLEDVRSFIEGMAKKYPNVIAISGESFLPKNPSYYSDFTLHPNDLGFEFYGKSVTEEILKNI